MGLARNVIAGGYGRSIAMEDVFAAITPKASGPLGKLPVLGSLRGDVQTISMVGLQAIMAKNFKATADSSCTSTNPDETPANLLLTCAGGVAHKGVDNLLTSDGGTTVWSPFTPVSGKALCYEARVKVSAIGDTAFCIGFCKNPAAAVLNGSDVPSFTDGIWFSKSLTTGDLSLTMRKSSTDTVTPLGVALSNDSYLTVGFAINGVNSVEWYAGTKKSKITVMTNLPAGVQMTLFNAMHITGTTSRTGRILRQSVWQVA